MYIKYYYIYLPNIYVQVYYSSAVKSTYKSFFRKMFMTIIYTLQISHFINNQ